MTTERRGFIAQTADYYGVSEETVESFYYKYYLFINKYTL